MMSSDLWTRSEADIFRAVAVGRGVPRERILLERESTNTGENVRLTHRLLSHLGISASCLLLVHGAASLLCFSGSVATLDCPS
ncbi:hypothetical protein ACOMHN_011141 [Nucella lapillus]